MKYLLTNIKELIQVRENNVKKIAGEQMKELPSIKNAYLAIEDEKIIDYGSMENLNLEKFSDYKKIQLQGRYVLPTFVDSHTHIVYAGSREKEFVDKIRGLTYEEIARRGGGILNSAKRLHEATEDELFQSAMQRIQEMIHWGTGAIEIKSGYGLNTEDEIKMLKVIKRLKDHCSIPIVATFLGAHAIPAEYKDNPSKYVDIVINEMIPIVAAEKLADYIDVFCDRGFFSVEDTDKILNAGAKYGLRAKIHANELGFTGGVQVGVKYNALSVDHLEYVAEKEIEALQNSETMPTVLPSTSFYLNLKYAPARKIIDSGLPLAIASDYNPGSSPSGNMKFVFSLATIKLKLLPQEAFNAMTINTAYAIDMSDSLGSISRGKLANIIITKPIPSFEYFPYAFSSDLIEKVMIKGKFLRN